MDVDTQYTNLLTFSFIVTRKNFTKIKLNFLHCSLEIGLKTSFLKKPNTNFSNVYLPQYASSIYNYSIWNQLVHHHVLIKRSDVQVTTAETKLCDTIRIVFTQQASPTPGSIQSPSRNSKCTKIAQTACCWEHNERDAQNALLQPFCFSLHKQLVVEGITNATLRTHYFSLSVSLFDVNDACLQSFQVNDSTSCRNETDKTSFL